MGRQAALDRQSSHSPATRRDCTTSMLPVPYWHRATQTHFPPTAPPFLAASRHLWWFACRISRPHRRQKLACTDLRTRRTPLSSCERVEAVAALAAEQRRKGRMVGQDCPRNVPEGGRVPFCSSPPQFANAAFSKLKKLLFAEGSAQVALAHAHLTWRQAGGCPQ